MGGEECVCVAVVGGVLFIFKCVHEMMLLKKRSTGSELMKLSDAGRGKKENPN